MKNITLILSLLVMFVFMQSATNAEVLFGSKNIISDTFDAANGVSAADIDGDGDIDVIGTASTAGDITWWENINGEGTVWTEHLLDGDFAGAVDASTADIDGDGDLDILGAAHVAHEISWWENPGDSSAWAKHVVDTYFLRANHAVAVDLDGDGDLDVLASGHDGNGISWWENINGEGTSWAKVTVRAGMFSTSVDAADVDGDGDLDVFGNDRYTNSTLWWENANGDGSAWTEHIVRVGVSARVYAADVNADGHVDVLGATLYDDKIIWWENTNGDGTVWTEYIVSGNFDDAISVYAADIDTDGDLDIVGAAPAADNITWWENINGDGTEWIEYPIDGNFDYARDVYAADLNGDNYPDILGAAHFADEIAWWQNQGFKETLIVLADGSPVYSSVLEDGQWYKITAVGTYVGWVYYGMNLEADAEFRELQDHTWIHDPPQYGLYDILIDDTDVDWWGRDPNVLGSVFKPLVYSGEDQICGNGHIYTIYRLGRGQPVKFHIEDSYYPDNSGFLTVHITKEEPPPCIIIDLDNDGYSIEMGDCNDNDPSINPGVIEVCDNIDNNCNGQIDEGFDLDEDGFSQCEGDCDDFNPLINPSAQELPGNAIDDNCDGSLGACDPNNTWENHGEYVRCVAHEIEELVNAGDITQDEGDELVNSAAQSEIGKNISF